jgi:hypothetical protein
LIQKRRHDVVNRERRVVGRKGRWIHLFHDGASSSQRLCLQTFVPRTVA